MDVLLHRGYINSSLLESDLKMSESPANVVSFDERNWKTMQWKTFYPLISEFSLQLDWQKYLFSLLLCDSSYLFGKNKNL